MNKDELAPQRRGVINTKAKGVSCHSLATLILFTLALSACGGGDTALQPFVGEPLAVAYINKDGIKEYSEPEDILIAGLFDTNEDGIPSAGDTVRFGSYPSDYDALTINPFNIPDAVVVGTPLASAEAVTISYAGGHLTWSMIPFAYDLITGIYPVLGLGDLEITDFGLFAACDVIQVTEADPSFSIVAVDLPPVCDDADNDFLNVQIFASGSI